MNSLETAWVIMLVSSGGLAVLGALLCLFEVVRYVWTDKMNTPRLGLTLLLAGLFFSLAVSVSGALLDSSGAF